VTRRHRRTSDGVLTVDRSTPPLSRLNTGSRSSRAPSCSTHGAGCRSARRDGPAEHGRPHVPHARRRRDDGDRRAGGRALVAGVAHELRTPATILQASCEEMVDGLAEPAPERLGSLRDEVLRLDESSRTSKPSPAHRRPGCTSDPATGWPPSRCPTPGPASPPANCPTSSSGSGVAAGHHQAPGAGSVSPSWPSWPRHTAAGSPWTASQATARRSRCCCRAADPGAGCLLLPVTGQSSAVSPWVGTVFGDHSSFANSPTVTAHTPSRPTRLLPDACQGCGSR
jgi:hypothetical protein